MKKNKRLVDIITYIVLIAVFVITAFPLFYTVMSSFKTNAEIMSKPGMIISQQPSFDNYLKTLKSPDFYLPQLFFNSLWYTAANVFISIMTATMAGYVFVRGHFRFKKQIYACFAALLFIKLGGVAIYATFDVLNFLHIPKSLPSLVFVRLFSIPIIYLMLVMGYMESLPRELDEAAKIDGCSFPGIFFRIIMPLLKPIIATIAIMAFNDSWNEYLMPTIFTLTNPEQRTLIVGLMALKSGGGAATSWDIMFAGSIIAVIPVLIAYALCNKYFVSGLTAGAVKG